MDKNDIPKPQDSDYLWRKREEMGSRRVKKWASAVSVPFCFLVQKI